MQCQPRGFLAMSGGRPMAEELRLQASGESVHQQRLHKGPAYGKVPSPSLPSTACGHQSATDWPTFRHDAMRSGRATSPIPAAPKQAWKIELGGKVSAPVVAGGRVFVASADKHQVVAVDAASGKRVWSYTAGGPVDCPPTASHGRVLFGCRSGCVYSTRALAEPKGT